MGMLPRRLLASLSVLPLAALVDRLVLRIAEARVAARIHEAVGFGSKPKVSIKGFPFLAQAALKRFAEVHITSRDLHRGVLPIARLGLILYGVRPRGKGRVHVDGLGGTALIAFPDLVQAGNRPLITLTAAGDDLVKITASAESLVAGLASPLLGPWPEVQVTSRVSLAGGDRIQVQVVAVDRLPPQLGQTAAELLDFTVPVPSLPKGLPVVGLRVVSEGIELKISGQAAVFGGVSG